VISVCQFKAFGLFALLFTGSVQSLILRQLTWTIYSHYHKVLLAENMQTGCVLMYVIALCTWASKLHYQLLQYFYTLLFHIRFYVNLKKNPILPF